MEEERQENHESPEVLCRRVKAGNQAAFSLLVRLFQKKVFLLALSILRNREDALDAVQETFMKVYQSLNSFEEERNFENWLLRIAKNVAIDHYRRQRSKGRSEQETLPLESVEPWLAATNENPRKTEMKRLIEAVLDELAERQRLVFVLRHFQGFSYEEVASTLGIAVGTVKSLHFKALERLKSLVGQRLATRSFP